nr:hypothetical protein CFP56_38862 [Quercus suber]
MWSCFDVVKLAQIPLHIDPQHVSVIDRSRQGQAMITFLSNIYTSSLCGGIAIQRLDEEGREDVAEAYPPMNRCESAPHRLAYHPQLSMQFQARSRDMESDMHGDSANVGRMIDTITSQRSRSISVWGGSGGADFGQTATRLNLNESRTCCEVHVPRVYRSFGSRIWPGFLHHDPARELLLVSPPSEQRAVPGRGVGKVNKDCPHLPISPSCNIPRDHTLEPRVLPIGMLAFFTLRDPAVPAQIRRWPVGLRCFARSAMSCWGCQDPGSMTLVWNCAIDGVCLRGGERACGTMYVCISGDRRGSARLVMSQIARCSDELHGKLSTHKTRSGEKLALVCTFDGSKPCDQTIYTAPRFRDT